MAGIAEAAPSSTRTFLFADLAGFTAMTEAHWDQGADRAVKDFYSAVRRLLPDYEADEAKTIGDALMLRIADTGAAVQSESRCSC